MTLADNVEIRREDHRSIAAYATVPVEFEVREVVDVSAMRPGRAVTVPTRAIATPWRKDYDGLPGNDPGGWSTRFDVARWIHLAAYDGASRLGGAIVVADPTAGAQLGGRADTAVLWDLRVMPAARRRGIGRALLGAAEDAAGRTTCRALDVETQDINVAACRLYSDSGYALMAIDRNAYAEAPGETRLLWSKRL